MLKLYGNENNVENSDVWGLKEYWSTTDTPQSGTGQLVCFIVVVIKNIV